MYNIYIPKHENLESIFGSNHPICMSGAELRAYAKEHDMIHEPLRLQFRLATEEDIARWGVQAPPMSPVDFSFFWACAMESPSKEAFISDAALSYLWGDIGIDEPILKARLEFLNGLWDAAHMPLNDFADAAGISIGDLCKYMGIDYHTKCSWQSDPNNIPENARIMMARALHIIPGASCNSENEELSPDAFWHFWANAVDTPNSEHYVADNGVTLIWPVDAVISDEESGFQEFPADRFAILENIWDAAHGTLEMFANQSGVSIGDLCRTMGIDYHTSRIWLADSKAIPEYARVMLARVTGMI